MSAFKRVQQWATFARTWHLYDARWQNPFDSAVVIKKYLTGAWKPIFHPMTDCGDHVVIINSHDIALPNTEWYLRAYFHHRRYPGSDTLTPAWALHEKDDTLIVKKAVYRILDKNLKRRYHMERLHIFSDDKLPADIAANITNQIRPFREVPTRLCEIPEDVASKFPQILDHPKDFVLNADALNYVPIETAKPVAPEQKKKKILKKFRY